MLFLFVFNFLKSSLRMTFFCNFSSFLLYLRSRFLIFFCVFYFFIYFPFINLSANVFFSFVLLKVYFFSLIVLQQLRYCSVACCFFCFCLYHTFNECSFFLLLLLFFQFLFLSFICSFFIVYCCFYYLCLVYMKFIALFVLIVRRRDFTYKIKFRSLILVEKLISVYELDPLNRSGYGKARYSYGYAISHRYSSFQV